MACLPTSAVMLRPEFDAAAFGAEFVRQAPGLAETFEPQIALLDIGMPRMDGYEAARRIRGLLGTRVVLVALTGWGQDEDIRRAREAGFDRHLTKPAEPEAFEELIAACAQPPPADTPDGVAPPASKQPD